MILSASLKSNLRMILLAGAVDSEIAKPSTDNPRPEDAQDILPVLTRPLVLATVASESHAEMTT